MFSVSFLAIASGMPEGSGNANKDVAFGVSLAETVQIFLSFLSVSADRNYSESATYLGLSPCANFNGTELGGSKADSLDCYI